MLTLNEIRNVNFRKANFGGYRAEDVEAFIDEVQLSYDTLLRENAELVKKLEILAAKLEEYQSEEDSIRSALMNAQKVGDASLRDAKHKAEIILKDATIKAEKIVANAQAEVLHERDIIERMQRDIADFKSKLLRVYREHLTLINNIPTEDIMRPETRSAVESIQMLDRQAVEPAYDTRQSPQLPSDRLPQISADSEAPSGFTTERGGMGADDRAPMPVPPQGGMPGGQDFAPAPAPAVVPRSGSQRKGGFTVDIEDGAGGAGAPRRRDQRFPSFEGDPSTQGGAPFGDAAAPGFDIPADEGETGTPPSGFFAKRRGGKN